MYTTFIGLMFATKPL